MNIGKTQEKVLFQAGVLLLFFGLATSCISSRTMATVGSFGQAVTVVRDNIENGYTLLDKQYVLTRTAQMTNKFDPNTFRPDTVVSFFKRDEIALRLKLLDGLQVYADALAFILSDQGQNDLDKNSKDFGKSLLQLNGDTLKTKFFKPISSPIPASDASIIATAVHGIGSLLLDYKKKQGLKSALTKADAPVHKLCELFMLDIGKSNQEGIRGQLFITNQQLQMEEYSFLVHNADKLGPIEKRAQIEKVMNLSSVRTKMDLVLQHTYASIQQLLSIHSEMVQQLGEKNTFHLDSAIQSLITEGNKIQKFYDDLNN